MHFRSLFSVFVVLALVAAASACSGSSGDDSLPEGWERLDGDGFSLALPDAWEGGDPQRQIPDIVEDLRAQYPERSDIWDQLESSAEDVAFMAFDLDDVRAGEEFVTNVNVVRTAMPAGADLREVVEAQVPLLEDQLGAEDVMLEEKRVGELDAVVLSYRARLLGLDLAQWMYTFANPETGDVFIVTFSTDWERREDKARTFEEIAATFRIGD